MAPVSLFARLIKLMFLGVMTDDSTVSTARQPHFPNMNVVHQ